MANQVVSSQIVEMLSTESFIRGYHAYMDVWTPVEDDVGTRTSNVLISLVNCPIIVVCLDYLKTFVSVYVSFCLVQQI